MNQARGEVALVIEGVAHVLCVTIGALAEIESALGLSSLAELGDRLRHPSVADVLAILGALLRGGGHEIADAALARLQVDLAAAAKAITDAFAAAGLAK